MTQPDGLHVPMARRLLEIVTGSWMSQAVSVAAQLGISDVLACGPKSSDEIAAATGAHAPSLRHLLRALTTIDICREVEDGSFELTAMGSLLRRDVPDSLRSWTIFWGSRQWPLWGHLLYSVQTGESARRLLLGTEGFDHLEGDPEAAAVFHQAMTELTRLISHDVVRAVDFSRVKRVVDVGGGYGELLAAILEANPGTNGVLFDLPHALETGKVHIEAVGLADRCAFVPGNFFESVPAGADAYVLKSVLHNWNDERSRVILENCRRAMTPGGKILLVERLMPERLDTSPAHREVAGIDLNMLIAHAAQERTEGEFRTLLSTAGLRATRIVPIQSTLAVIEALAVS